VGTVAALSAVIEQQGWTLDAALIVTAIVATGAGLACRCQFHRAQGPYYISPLATVLTVAVPVGVFLGLVYSLYYYLVRRFDPFHVWLLMATAAVVAVAVIAALSGISMAVSLVILSFAPAVTVIGYEVRGYRHQAESLVTET
jgi:hypothetical protein